MPDKTERLTLAEYRALKPKAPERHGGTKTAAPEAERMAVARTAAATAHPFRLHVHGAEPTAALRAELADVLARHLPALRGAVLHLSLR